jgi:hypothetical protein
MTTSKHSEVAASKGIVELAAGMGLTFVAQLVTQNCPIPLVCS